jgi:predicted lipoprotein with Yx(FWY)xxD motif
MKTSRWWVPVLAAGLVLAGCSKTDDTTTNTGGSPGSGGATTTKAAGGGAYGDYGDKTATTPTTAAASNAAGSVEVKTASTAVGEILVDGSGMTLYQFKKDTGTTSACTGDCEKAWPPLTGTAKAGKGVDAASFATADRPGGAKQITYKGHLLYHFSGDSKAGDMNGQGLNDVWYVVGVDGNPVEKDA